MTKTTKILQFAEKLDSFANKAPSEQFEALKAAALEVGKAWSGSWLGYHSRVYYEHLEPVPPGARFSIEWGLMVTVVGGSIGSWEEFQFDSLKAEIKRRSKVKDFTALQTASKEVAAVFDATQAALLSILSPISLDHVSDKFLMDLVNKIRKESILTYSDCVKAFPKANVVSRDMVAIQAGATTPPHLSVLAETYAIASPFTACANLAKWARRVASHLDHLTNKNGEAAPTGTNVFIGHGRSKVWKDLKDFIRDRLHLPYDEFNRVPVAGFTNIARLSQMLDSAAVAFIILTAEDEQVDGEWHARMNVIHEAGLFQGRLGFERAIILLEEGCAEFSNIQGLGQIRFPTGDISAKFEDIRRVLEREVLIE